MFSAAGSRRQSSARCNARFATVRTVCSFPATPRQISSCSSFVYAAVISGLAGALYTPQVGIINPSEMSPEKSLEAVVWVAVGGRGTLVGPIIGSVGVNALKSWATRAYPDLWLIILGGLFVLIVLFMPKGIVGIPATDSRTAQALPEGGSLPSLCLPAEQQARAQNENRISFSRPRGSTRASTASRPFTISISIWIRASFGQSSDRTAQARAPSWT